MLEPSCKQTTHCVNLINDTDNANMKVALNHTWVNSEY